MKDLRLLQREQDQKHTTNTIIYRYTSLPGLEGYAYSSSFGYWWNKK